jgi:hypothetical protein
MKKSKESGKVSAIIDLLNVIAIIAFLKSMILKGDPVRRT